jgi:hypothetical protein
MFTAEIWPVVQRELRATTIESFYPRFLPPFASYRVQNIVMATAYTWLLALGGPLFGVVTLAFFGPAARGNPMLVYVGIVLENAVLVWFIFGALRDNLRRRAYSVSNV